MLLHEQPSSGEKLNANKRKEKRTSIGTYVVHIKRREKGFTALCSKAPQKRYRSSECVSVTVRQRVWEGENE